MKLNKKIQCLLISIIIFINLFCIPVKSKADELIGMLNTKVNIKLKNINYIDGADHGYSKKEEILAKEIVDFLSNIL